MTQKLKEILGPQDGILSYEDKLAPVFCKPKLIPLKSVTIEKLEKMQQDASEKAEYAKNHENDFTSADVSPTTAETKTDIWSSDQQT